MEIALDQRHVARCSATSASHGHCSSASFCVCLVAASRRPVLWSALRVFVFSAATPVISQNTHTHTHTPTHLSTFRGEKNRGLKSDPTTPLSDDDADQRRRYPRGVPRPSRRRPPAPIRRQRPAAGAPWCTAPLPRLQVNPLFSFDGVEEASPYQVPGLLSLFSNGCRRWQFLLSHWSALSWPPFSLTLPRTGSLYCLFSLWPAVLLSSGTPQRGTAQLEHLVFKFSSWSNSKLLSLATVSKGRKTQRSLINLLFFIDNPYHH